MTSVSATAARSDLYNLMSMVNDECKPVTITNSKGKSAVLVGEDERNAIEETLYLNGVPGLVDSIKESMSEPLDAAVSADELDW